MQISIKIFECSKFLCISVYCSSRMHKCILILDEMFEFVKNVIPYS